MSHISKVSRNCTALRTSSLDSGERPRLESIKNLVCMSTANLHVTLPFMPFQARAWSGKQPGIAIDPIRPPASPGPGDPPPPVKRGFRSIGARSGGGWQVPSVGRSVVTASHTASAADRAPVRPSPGGPPRPVGLQSPLLHGGVAVGAATTNLGRDVHDPLGLAGIRGLAPSSPMSRPRTFPLGRLGRQGQLPHAPSLKTPGAPGRDASGPQQACSTPAHREAVASSRKHCPLSVEDGTNRGTAQPQVVP
jgi:hypothetical protein